MKKNGKFLEMLVECLQRILINEEIKVTPNKKYYNEKNIQIAEVDILLEGKIGSANLKIAIECRDRKEIQDRPWIQQIDGRRNDLKERGINHWIAVSSSGFTTTAIDLAKEINIELLVPKLVDINEDKLIPILSKSRFPSLDWIKHTGITLEHAVIDHDDNYTPQQIERILQKFKEFSPKITVQNPQSKKFYNFPEYINEKSKKIQSKKLRNIEPLKDLTFAVKTEFPTLKAKLGKLKFLIKDARLEFIYTQKNCISDFRFMEFYIPETDEILGVIGVNEYKTPEMVCFVMVGIRPNHEVDIMLIKDEKGNDLSMKTTFLIPYQPNMIPTKFHKYKINPK